MKPLKRLLTALVLCLFASFAMAEGVFPDLSRPFEALFLPRGVEWTENSYRSQNLYIQITTRRECGSDVYIAEIYARTAQSLRRAFGGEAWNTRSERIGTLAQRSGAVLALMGDNGHLLKAGYVVGNGQLWRSRGNQQRDLCVLYRDGSMVIHKAPADEALIDAQQQQGLIWQTFVFGPSLLDDAGKALEAFPTSDVERSNPRAVIGYDQPGHYYLVQVDGRGTLSTLEPGASNEGMTLAQLAQLMESLGCSAAYNLDGGQSASMWFCDRVISTPYHNGRAVGDVIVLCEPPGNAADSIESFLVE